MRTKYIHNASLPCLAWVATWESDSGIIVEHGKYVEVQPGFFFEGAWAGEFSAGRPDTTEVVFGSGAIISEDSILIVSSLATTDYIFHRRDPRSARVVAANSLALLLSATEDALDPQFGKYAEVNDSIMEGFRNHNRVIPTKHGSVFRLMHNNLRIDALGCVEVEKPQSLHFPDFPAYRSYLEESYAALAHNAQDPIRRRPLRIYSTQSRGYDTTAVNAIAARHHLDGVFTVRTGKCSTSHADQPDEPEVNDDGTEIAKILGIAPIFPIERRVFRQGFDDEVHYHAAIHECQDLNFKQISQHLEAPALLLTGTLGELWSTVDPYYAEHPMSLRGEDLRRVDLGGHGLTEVRLRAGYIQAAIPYIGARRRPEIIAIAESANMAHWRLGGTYDRPVPRRLAEDAGVPREAFGQRKIGSVVEFPQPQIPQSEALRKAYFDFLLAEGLKWRWQLRLFPLVHWANGILLRAKHGPRLYWGIHYLYRIGNRLFGREIPPLVVWDGLRGSLHCFAVNDCAKEYRGALSRRL